MCRWTDWALRRLYLRHLAPKGFKTETCPVSHSPKRTLEVPHAKAGRDCRFLRTAAAGLLLAGFTAFLAGCQGVSAGPSIQQSPQQQGSTLSVNNGTLNFGNVVVGSTATLTVTATNSGPSSVTVSSLSISTQFFKLVSPSLPVTVASGQSVTVTVSFTPNAVGTFNATATITSDASNATSTVNLTGAGVSTAQPGTLSASPATLSVGSVTVGSSGTASGTLSATGATVTVTAASTNNAAFKISGLTFPATVPVGGSVPFTVTFSPTAAGAASATLTFTSNGQPTSTTEALSGTGISVSQAGQLSVSPTSLNLGSIVAGLSGTGSGTLTATGASVTVTGASSNSSLFVVSGLTLPVTIAAGKSVPFTVTFSPTVAGTFNATLTFTASNAQSPTTTDALTGIGTAAPVHSVNLSWTASTSSNISGYNIYRAVYSPAPVSACGAFTRIVSLTTGTLYTDSKVTDGIAYCYAATAVNTSNQESGYSNIVSDVQIPAP